MFHILSYVSLKFTFLKQIDKEILLLQTVWVAIFIKPTSLHGIILTSHTHNKNFYTNLFTLQEHQKFRTETGVSVISDLLKSMGGIFCGIFPLKNPQISQRCQHPFWKLVYSLKVLCIGICYQIIFKCNWARNQRKLQFCLTTPFLSISNFWHVHKLV